MIMATIDYDYKIDVIRDKIEEIGASNVILQFQKDLKLMQWMLQIELVKL